MYLEHLPPGTEGRSDIHNHPSMVLQHIGERGVSVSRPPEDGSFSQEDTHPEELLIDHARHVEGPQGVNVHHGLEGIGGQRTGRTQEVSSRTCRVEGDRGWCWSPGQLEHKNLQGGPSWTGKEV